MSSVRLCRSCFKGARSIGAWLNFSGRKRQQSARLSQKWT